MKAYFKVRHTEILRRLEGYELLPDRYRYGQVQGCEAIVRRCLVRLSVRLCLNADGINAFPGI